MTDYEKFIKSNGRDELIKQVRKKIDQLGIDYLYLQFVSVTGRIMGKGIPAEHWENIANGGFQLVYGATVNLFMNRRGEYLGYGPEAAELVGVPEPETFMQLPWDKRVARMFCTLFRNREEKENPGAYLTSDCRGNLRRMVDRGLLDMSDIRILWQSELIPEGPYVVRKALPQEAKDLYRQVLLDLAERDRACFKRMVGGDAVDFEPITQDYYETIIDIQRKAAAGDS